MAGVCYRVCLKKGETMTKTTSRFVFLLITLAIFANFFCTEHAYAIKTFVAVPDGAQNREARSVYTTAAKNDLNRIGVPISGELTIAHGDKMVAGNVAVLTKQENFCRVLHQKFFRLKSGYNNKYLAVRYFKGRWRLIADTTDPNDPATHLLALYSPFAENRIPAGQLRVDGYKYIGITSPVTGYRFMESGTLSYQSQYKGAFLGETFFVDKRNSPYPNGAKFPKRSGGPGEPYHYMRLWHPYLYNLKSYKTKISFWLRKYEAYGELNNSIVISGRKHGYSPKRIGGGFSGRRQMILGVVYGNPGYEPISANSTGGAFKWWEQNLPIAGTNVNGSGGFTAKHSYFSLEFITNHSPAGFTNQSRASKLYLRQVSVANMDNIWAIDGNGKVYRWNGSSFTPEAAAPKLSNISVGTDGVVWGVTAADGWLYKRENNAWAGVTTPTKVRQVSAGNKDAVWYVRQDGKRVYEKKGNRWILRPGGIGQVSVGSDGVVWGVKWDAAHDNSAWGTDPKGYKFPVYRWSASAKTWKTVAFNGSVPFKSVSVGDRLNIWGVDTHNTIYKWNGTAWARAGAKLNHVLNN